MQRRTLLGAAVAAGVIGATVKQGRASAARSDIGVSVFAFPLSAVTLNAGPFLDNMNRTLAYLSFVDIDRLLYNFRVNVGISTSAQPVGGWESPTTELRGHSVGHLLTALAQAYANTRNTAYKTKGDNLVAALAACQAASPSRGYHTGYLSAYPENFFDRLESGQSVWAPYYTIHKIMAGLLDQYLLAGNSQALSVVTAMAGWVKTRTDPLSSSTMQNVVLRTEFGGMPEVLTNLYQVSSNPDHLTTAQRFDHAQILNPLASNQDALSGFHANTQIPKIIGAIREYHATGTTRYRDIANNFWDIVIRHHTYVNGGNSNGEYFQTPDAIARQLSDTTCECCNTYNMLKLTRQLFFTNPARVDYVDYYENALFNQILGQQDPNSSHGFVTYYTPLRAGGIKTYTNDYNSFTCDHGTGMESNTKYADSIYFFAGETLYVNLFIASTLTWPSRSITVTQATSFPTNNSTRLTIGGSGHIALKLRIPAWVTGATVQVNGATQSVTATPGSYVTLDRTWANGDVVDVSFGAALSFPRTNDDATVGAVKYGGILYAGEYGNTDLGGTLPTLQTATVTSAGSLHFTGTASTGTASLIPFYKMHHQRYTVYWKMSGSTGGGGSYEAETATLAGQAAVRSVSGASGGAVVGFIGNGTANTVRFANVSSTRAGSHTVTIYYASGAARSVTLTVNGTAGPTVATPSTGGWSTIGSVTTNVNLNAGNNTIQLGNTTGWAPDVDRIVVGA